MLRFPFICEKSAMNNTRSPGCRTPSWCAVLLTVAAVCGLPLLPGCDKRSPSPTSERAAPQTTTPTTGSERGSPTGSDKGPLTTSNKEPVTTSDKGPATGDDKNRPKNIALSQNNLKEIMLALHNYHATYKRLPPWAVCDKAGKPLLSWRVLILPFLETGELYQQFKLDEPWDGPNNSKLVEKMPDVFAAPGFKSRPGLSYYQGFVGKQAGWELLPDAKASHGARGLKLIDFTDGTSNTIGVIEAGEPVPWTKPADLPFEAGKPLPKIGGIFGNLANVARFDGSVVAISVKAPPQTLQAAITRNGGEAFDFDELLWKENKK
jgi:hypothetical protein